MTAKSSSTKGAVSVCAKEQLANTRLGYLFNNGVWSHTLPQKIFQILDSAFPQF